MIIIFAEQKIYLIRMSTASYNKVNTKKQIINLDYGQNDWKNYLNDTTSYQEN